MKTTTLRVCVFASVLLLMACHGPGHVEFTDGKCVIDGRPATLAEVETRQAAISERIVGRQPLFVLVTILIVVLAGFSHLEKLLLLFSTRRSAVHGLGQRLRVALDRYRDQPIRYFVLVGATLGLLGCAGSFYVYLDADKRASDRALGLLQFCHLALRNNEAEGILAQQRQNLEAIQSTAGSIRDLVDKLPPDQQRKAKQIVEQINSSLASQGRLVADYVTKTEESTKAVLARTQTLERGLSTLETGFSSLKPVPGALHDFAEQLKGIDGRLQVSSSGADAKLAALKTQLEALAARPECPACVCEGARAPTMTPHDGGAAAK
jgi:hypothetical protein